MKKIVLLLFAFLSTVSLTMATDFKKTEPPSGDPPIVGNIGSIVQNRAVIPLEFILRGKKISPEKGAISLPGEMGYENGMFYIKEKSKTLKFDYAWRSYGCMLGVPSPGAYGECCRCEEGSWIYLNILGYGFYVWQMNSIVSPDRCGSSPPSCNIVIGGN